MANIQRTAFKVSDFVNWQKYGSLVLSPKFQRRSVWDDGARSYLIDTILKGLPIPVIILRDIKTDISSYESKKEVVDGQQRLRCIIAYIDSKMIGNEKPFKVKAIHNNLAGGKLFSELSDDLKQKILDYEFFVHVLPANVSDREILEIFSRMNSTGYKLNNQELRNAKYYGEFKSVVYNTALEFYDFWLKSGILTDAKIARMDEVDIMNDLFSIVMDGIINRSPEVIDKYYIDYDGVGTMKHKDEIVSRIRNTLNFLNELLKEDFKGLLFSKKRPLFYILFCVVYDLRYGLKSALKKATPKKLNSGKLRENILATSNRLKNEDRIPEKVIIAYSKGTNRSTARSIVFNFLKKELSNGV